MHRLCNDGALSAACGFLPGLGSSDAVHVPLVEEWVSSWDLRRTLESYFGVY